MVEFLKQHGFVAAMFIFSGMVIGILLPAFLSFSKQRFTPGNFPKPVAMDFRDKFAHIWLTKWAFPKTECTVHELESLEKYLYSVRKWFESIDTAGKKKGVAIYLAQSYNSKHYAHKCKDETFRCVLKRKYTSFMIPVTYTEKEIEIEGRHCKPPDRNNNEAELPEKFFVKVIHCFDDPFDKKSNPKFKEKLWNFIRAEEDEAFDLGHTHP